MPELFAPYLQSLARLLIAAALGAVVGWEREARHKPAGLRTNMMVAIGAAGFTLTASLLIGPSVDADPTRIVTAVATGIGFLGAGTITRARGSVEGITTAAGIWVVGAIGAACGAGSYHVAVPMTVLALFILTAIGWLEEGKKNR